MLIFTRLCRKFVMVIYADYRNDSIEYDKSIQKSIIFMQTNAMNKTKFSNMENINETGAKWNCCDFNLMQLLILLVNYHLFYLILWIFLLLLCTNLNMSIALCVSSIILNMDTHFHSFYANSIWMTFNLFEFLWIVFV